MRKLLILFILVIAFSGYGWVGGWKGNWKGGWLGYDRFFRFNVINTQTIAGEFSTMDGKTIEVDWGDGSRSTYSGIDQAYSKDYGSAGNRTVTICRSGLLTKFTMMQAGANITFNLANLPAGLTYFYCLGSNTVSGDLANLPAGLTHFYCFGSNTVSGDLANLPAGLTYFYCSGSNTVSGDLANLPAGLTHFDCSGSNTVSGDLANLPAGLTHFYCSGSNTVSGDLANLPAGLTYFYCSGSNTVSGDLANLPAGLTHFYCLGLNTVSGDLANLPAGLTHFYCSGSNTVSDYSGKAWTTKPAIFITIPIGGGMIAAEVDQLLIDFDDDLVWAAGNEITITGTHAGRTAASDAAVLNMEAEGATVTTN